MSPRPDVSAERRPQILQAAQRVFARKGFQATRMEEIAAEAGLSVGSLYWYYKGKEAMTLALLEWFLKPDVEALRALVDAPGSCRQRLWGYFLKNLQEEAEVLILSIGVRALATRNAHVRACLQEYYAQYRDALAELLAQGMKRGELRPGAPQAAAVMLLALYDGLLQAVLLAPAPLDLEAQLRQTFDFVFDGLSEKREHPSCRN